MTYFIVTQMCKWRDSFSVTFSEGVSFPLTDITILKEGSSSMNTEEKEYKSL